MWRSRQACEKTHKPGISNTGNWKKCQREKFIHYSSELFVKITNALAAGYQVRIPESRKDGPASCHAQKKRVT
jgi:hypothetical protein